MTDPPLTSPANFPIFLCDMWHVTCDIWQMKCDMWHVTLMRWWTLAQNVRSHTLKVLKYLWHVTCDMWHVTSGMWLMSITHMGCWRLSQNFRSLALTVWKIGLSGGLIYIFALQYFPYKIKRAFPPHRQKPFLPTYTSTLWPKIPQFLLSACLVTKEP